MWFKQISLVAMLLGASVPLCPGPAWAFSATFSWTGIPACASVSPAFALAGLPKGTAALAFVMHDRQAPDFEHGGSTVPYAGGGRVPQSAITYTGPCPPPGERHRYVWTIEARDGAGNVLGRVASSGMFPPESRR